MERYDSYKDSGVEWIGEIPSHWRNSKTNFLSSNYDGKRVPLNGTQRSEMEGEIPYWGSNGVVDYINKSMFNEELVLVGEDGSPFFDIYKPISFKVTGDVWINNHIHVLKHKESEVLPDFLVHSFNITDFKEFITGSTRDKLTQSDLSRIPHFLPPLSEQQQIVSFLDTKTSLIDSLIEKTQQKIELLKEKRQKLVEEVVLNDKIERVRLEHVVDLVKRPINREDNETYNKIGMYNWGRGIFKYPTEEGSELGDSTFNFIKEGDLLLSGQFSWEGSVSMVGKEVHNCISSHRFHILMGRKDIILNEYLWSYFTSQEGHFLLTENSFGSSGRNQPLNIGRLLKEKIPIPELSFQLKIKELVEYTRRFEKHSKRNIELLKEYRQSLISEVVTGKRKVV
ncbi:restriction endonuclease subunit S [Cyclobacteriaceae bacterium]|nr:restriction endonuclease subunit S [Cyclobacteriaceae bacterium]